MKLRSLIYCFAALSFLASCKDSSTFTISGTIKNPDSLKMVYLLEADSSRINVIDSTNLSEEGKFQFKRSAPYANLYKLRIAGSIFDLIANNGDVIEFATDFHDEKHNYTIKGSENSEKIQEFNKLSNFYGDKNTVLAEQYQTKAEALGKESDSLMQVFLPMYLKNMADYSNAVLDFAHKDEASLAAFYAMSSLDPMKFEQQLVAYADVIKDKQYFNDNPGVQRFVHQMMEVKPISIGHKAPQFAINGLNNKPIQLADYKGKYVMLDFWASWCAPCRQENPNVVKQYHAFKDKGFNILGISLDTDRSKWEQAINADKLTWNHASDNKGFEGSIEAQYRIQAIPSNFIIDPQGIIVAKNITGRDLEEFLNKTFSKAQ